MNRPVVCLVGFRPERVETFADTILGGAHILTDARCSCVKSSIWVVNGPYVDDFLKHELFPRDPAIVWWEATDPHPHLPLRFRRLLESWDEDDRAWLRLATSCDQFFATEDQLMSCHSVNPATLRHVLNCEVCRVHSPLINR